MSTWRSSPQPLEKRRFYAQQNVARAYDEQRFGGASGARLNERELDAVRRLLPERGRILDLGCGTGRLSARLHEWGYSVVALDTAAEMLHITRARTEVPVVLADGFQLPFGAETFDAVVALRVAFHYRQLDPLLLAARGVLKRGGVLIFDTCSWSPRAPVAIGGGSWGGRVWVQRSGLVRRTAAELGFTVGSETAAFFLTPHLYRVLPLPFVLALEKLEKHAPSALLSRRLWRLEACC